MSEALVTAWGKARDRLRNAGVESPVLDARLLVEAGAGVARLDIVTDPRRELSEAQLSAIEALIRRREAREPVSQIIGRKAFWTLDFAVNSHVLTPRPETEFLVELALQLLPDEKPARVLDLGVGSGAILLSVLNERRQAHGLGLDLSPDALALARANADMLGLASRVELHQGGWETAIAPGDLVLSNPPYIASAEIEDLAPEVSLYEPRLALDGGPDGLDAYRAIIARLEDLLLPGGAFAFEVGRGQADTVNALLAEQGFSPEQPRRDLGGVARVVWGRGRGAKPV
jgi:release factor glutamine methyltransferase